MTTFEEYRAFVDLVNRQDFKDMMTWIEENTQFLTAPASTKYHKCDTEGLLEHTVSVIKTIMRIKQAVAKDISDEDCIIVAVLHDIGKAGNDSMVPLYSENEPTEKQKQYGYKANPPYLVNDNLVYMEHEMRTMYLINKCPVRIALSEEMYAAILLHNEPWRSQNCAFKKNRLMTLLQI